MNTYEPRRPREYPAVHPEKPSRALILVAVLVILASIVILAYTTGVPNQGTLDRPPTSPDIMEG